MSAAAQFDRPNAPGRIHRTRNEFVIFHKAFTAMAKAPCPV
jgi:hypothetical protein